MHALSMLQPWASLVTEGYKKIETRSWRTHHEGVIAIHASLSFPGPEQALTKQWPWAMVLDQFGDVGLLPRGAIIGTVRLIGCERTEKLRRYMTDIEVALGDWSDGRWAWLLAEPRAFPAPIPCTGHLGLWTIPDHVTDLIEHGLPKYVGSPRT